MIHISKNDSILDQEIKKAGLDVSDPALTKGSKPFQVGK
jgi:hypothetical protein